jgi:MtaA/CmuA family methyltransferase
MTMTTTMTTNMTTTMTGYERLFAHLAGEPVDHLPQLPIVMMFAADQIGQPYGKYASDYRVLAEGQIATAEKFGFDYVSTISDPAREAADCGATIVYFEDQPPAIKESEALLRDKRVLGSLQVPDPAGGGRMHDRIKAIGLLKEKIAGELPVEGWIEGPCAQAADLRGINNVMMDFFDEPEFLHELFEFIVEMELRFAKAQVDAGADWIGIGDAAASLVGPRIYKEFVFPHAKKMVDALHAMGTKVRLHICGNTSRILTDMGKLECDIVELDSMVSMAEASRSLPPGTFLLGNIDPVAVLRNGTPESIAKAVSECHRQVGSRYIVGAGCEVPRDTPPENLMALRDYARSHHP